jgi:DNA end-binding protein Ku
MLIDTMSAEEFKPEEFHDKYKEDVLAMIEARANGEQIEAPEIHKPQATNVVNLMDVLQRSLEQSKARRKKGASADEDEAEAKPAKSTSASRKKTPAAKPKRKKTAA